MGILFYCSNCERPLNVDEKFAGRPGKCPNCRETISVPFDSAISKEKFRALLDSWSQRKDVGELESGIVDIASSETKAFANIRPSSAKSESKAAPVVTLKPINVGGVATESEKVAVGISEKFSASAPDVLGESGPAVWFIRPPSGGQFGPASAKLLRQWIQEGRVTGDSYVWCEGWDNWQVAADVFPAIASKISTETISAENADKVTAARTRTAYMKARKRRTILTVAGLLVGTVIVIGLVVILFTMINNPSD